MILSNQYIAGLLLTAGFDSDCCDIDQKEIFCAES